MKNPQLKENVQNANGIVKNIFPNEKWVNAATLKFKHTGEGLELPTDIVGIWVAESKLTGLKDDEKVLAKEIKQGKILTDRGLIIYLLPKLKNSNGKSLTSPDALVNGVLFEFKNITGGLDRVEIRFRQSRNQCQNVYLKIDNPGISKEDVTHKIRSTLRDKNYTGGTEGNLIFYLAQTKKIYFMRIKDLK